MAQCDPLDPDTWPEGYLCVQHEGEWVLEKEAEGKKAPHTALIIGGAVGLLIGMMLAKGSRR